MRLAPQQISAAMALARLTQDELAVLVGIARPTLNKILNDEAVAKEDTMRRIRAALEQKGVEFIGNIGAIESLSLLQGILEVAVVSFEEY